MAKSKKTYTFHPASEQYPLMPDEELSILVDDMKVNGYDKRFPIILLDGVILDGRNRYRAAERSGVEPVFQAIAIKTDPEAFVQRANEHRRHLTQEWITKHRQERIARVSAARSEGESIRAIAEKEKVSPAQVVDDIKVAGVQGGCTPEPKKVTGKDGKTYPSHPQKPKQKYVCHRCQRIGKPVPDCAVCAAGEPEPDDVVDEPDETKEDEIKRINSSFESWCKELMVFAETMPDDPWLQDLNRRYGAIEKLKGACATIRSAKCSHICPKCKGNGCQMCHKTGRLTKHAFDSLGGK